MAPGNPTQPPAGEKNSVLQTGGPPGNRQVWATEGREGGPFPSCVLCSMTDPLKGPGPSRGQEVTFLSWEVRPLYSSPCLWSLWTDPFHGPHHATG